MTSTRQMFYSTIVRTENNAGRVKLWLGGQKACRLHQSAALPELIFVRRAESEQVGLFAKVLLIGDIQQLIFVVQLSFFLDQFLHLPAEVLKGIKGES